MNNLDKPEGIWGAILLPINYSNNIDWVAFSEQVDILCASSLNGIYTNGTAAECHNQTESEFDKLSEIVAYTASKNNKLFQLGVSHTNPRIARERLSRLTSFKPSGFQITLPDWWPPTLNEVKNFTLGMEEVAKNIPLILYNPPHAKVLLTLDEIANLRSIVHSLVGIKCAGGDQDWYEKRRNLLKNFSVFVPGHTVVYGKSLGANGSYSNVACLSPNGATMIWKLIESDIDQAIEIEKRINIFMQKYIMPYAKTLSNTGLDKLLAAAGGWGPVSEKLLWPYDSASPEDTKKIAKIAHNDLPELFE
jgi:dihydrodipicolinate synthase/N-acetylneuraminate lyase